MSEPKAVVNPEEGRTKLETYRIAIKDARHVFTTYKDKCPADAWECLRKILFNKDLR